MTQIDKIKFPLRFKTETQVGSVDIRETLIGDYWVDTLRACCDKCGSDSGYTVHWREISSKKTEQERLRLCQRCVKPYIKQCDDKSL
jgi:hypothetical protein